MTDTKPKEEKPAEAPERIIWTFHRKVMSIIEVKDKYNFRRSDDKADPSETNQTYDERTLGWTVRISDGSAIGYFPQHPKWEIGDELEMTITLKKRKKE